MPEPAVKTEPPVPTCEKCGGLGELVTPCTKCSKPHCVVCMEQHGCVTEEMEKRRQEKEAEGKGKAHPEPPPVRPAPAPHSFPKK